VTPHRKEYTLSRVLIAVLSARRAAALHMAILNMTAVTLTNPRVERAAKDCVTYG
jgi:hypothetical protein